MSNFILNTGDQLKVRADLGTVGYRVPYGTNESMKMLAGKTVTVNMVGRYNDRFFIKGELSTWHRYMIEEIIKGNKNEQEVEETRDYTDFKIGDVVRIRKASELRQIYGEDENGIKTYIPFTKQMERLSGIKATIEDVFGKFVRLTLLQDTRKTKDENGYAWSYTTDMIEIYKKKERKSVKMENIENQNIINEMISKVDVKKFKKILASSFAMPATKLKGVDKMLENWAKAKQNLYVLLGNNLKVSKEIEYNADRTFWSEQISCLSKQFPGIGYLLKDMSTDMFVDNRYDYFNGYIDEVEGVQEGMKVTKFLSKLFNNEEFDTALSKAIDQAKIRGNIVISIDPLDFLTMSFNQSGWRSCHTISHDGGSCNFGEYVRRYFQLHRR